MSSSILHGNIPYGRLPDLDEVTDGDRDWFDAHPAETERWRPITPAEIDQARAAGETFDRTWWVRVIKAPGGGRIRQFYPVAGSWGCTRTDAEALEP